MTDDERTIEAFWRSISKMPEDGLRRLVFADWLEENPGEIDCRRCNGSGNVQIYTGHGDYRVDDCWGCSGTGRIPDGRAELAEALRATADRVPQFYDCQSEETHESPHWTWWVLFREDVRIRPPCLEEKLFKELTLRKDHDSDDANRDYPTAESAIRDLCWAWWANRKDAEAKA